MNRNVSRQIAPERGVDIRQPSSAFLGVSTSDRYATKSQRYNSPSSPFDVLLTSKQNFLNGFFTRIALTEVRIPWLLPTIQSNRQDSMRLEYRTAAGVTTFFTLRINGDAWYTPTTLAAEVQRAMRSASPISGGVNKPNFTCTYDTAQYRFNYATNVAGDTMRFLPTLTNNTTGLYEMMAWLTTGMTAGFFSRTPKMIFTEFIDIVCNQLTYAQDVKDGDTGDSTRDVVARIYLAPEGFSDPTQVGTAPFIVYRQFQTPKQIKWDSNLPIGQLSFQVYDDRGNILTNGIDALGQAPFYDDQLGDWSISLLVSEV
jgi:hypothetical protein